MIKKKKLIVLCGHVGSGKSTLAQRFIELHPDFVFLDVYNYIQKYKTPDGFIEQSQTELAYSQFHSDLETLDKNIIAEIGINNAELNINFLKKLKAKHEVKIFFCLLPKEECLKRVELRAKKDPSRRIHPKLIESKFKFDFPAGHKKLATKLDVPFKELEMDTSDDLVQALNY